MGEDEPPDPGFPSHSPAVSRVHVPGARPVGRERAIQRRNVRAAAQAYQALAVLRIPGIDEDLSAVLDAVADAMEPRTVDDCVRRNAGLSQPEAPVGNFSDTHAKGRGVESGKRLQDHAEQPPGAARADEGQVWSLADESGIEHRIEEKGDEIREVVGMEM